LLRGDTMERVHSQAGRVIIIHSIDSGRECGGCRTAVIGEDLAVHSVSSLVIQDGQRAASSSKRREGAQTRIVGGRSHGSMGPDRTAAAGMTRITRTESKMRAIPEPDSHGRALSHSPSLHTTRHSYFVIRDRERASEGWMCVPGVLRCFNPACQNRAHRRVAIALQSWPSMGGRGASVGFS